MIILKKQHSLKQKTSSLFLNNFLPILEELRITSFCLFVCLPAEIVCVKVDMSASSLFCILPHPFRAVVVASALFCTFLPSHCIPGAILYCFTRSSVFIDVVSILSARMCQSLCSQACQVPPHILI